MNQAHQGSNPPLNQVPSSFLVYALYDFTADESCEMSMHKGDHLDVLDMDPKLNGWAYCRRRTDKKEGYVPVSYLGSKSKNKQHKGLSDSPGPNKQNKRQQQQHVGNPLQQQQQQLQQQQQQGQRNNNNNFRGNGPNGPNNNGPVSNAQNQPNFGQHGPNGQVHNVQHVQQVHGQQRGPRKPHPYHNGQKALKLSQLNDHDSKVMVCSFHRDFIPSVEDLYRYFGNFGKITNHLEVEHDSKRVPLAKIRFQSDACIEKVMRKGARQQIPSQSCNQNIYVRVWRSMQNYMAESTMKRNNNRQGGNGHGNRGGGGHNNGNRRGNGQHHKGGYGQGGNQRNQGHNNRRGGGYN